LLAGFQQGDTGLCGKIVLIGHNRHISRYRQFEGFTVAGYVGSLSVLGVICMSFFCQGEPRHHDFLGAKRCTQKRGSDTIAWFIDRFDTCSVAYPIYAVGRRNENHSVIAVSEHQKFEPLIVDELASIKEEQCAGFPTAQYFFCLSVCWFVS